MSQENVEIVDVGECACCQEFAVHLRGRSGLGRQLSARDVDVRVATNRLPPGATTREHRVSIRHRPPSLKWWRLGALLLVGLLFLAAFVGAGCGGNDEGDGGDETNAEQSAGEAAKSEQQPSQAQLRRFLMRKDEEPGFRPVEQPRTDTGVEAFVNGGGLTQADARRLRSEGFISFTFQPIEGPRTAGVTNVALYKATEGAKHSMAHDSRASVIRAIGDTKFRPFPVPGVPGARGWTGRDKHGHHIGHVYWVQGRCFLVLGNEGPGPFAGPLSTGARAIYERTNGECP